MKTEEIKTDTDTQEIKTDFLDDENKELFDEIDKIFNNFKAELDSDEFSEILAEKLYRQLFGQESYDKMKAKQAKKKVKREAKQARKEAGESTFTEKVFDTLKNHKRKTAAVASLSTCFFIGIVYGLLSK